MINAGRDWIGRVNENNYFSYGKLLAGVCNWIFCLDSKRIYMVLQISREKIDLVMMVVYIFSILSVSIAILSEAILFIIA